MSSYCKLKVKVEDSDTLEFYYAYNSRSTINDLIEFIAYYFPEKNICPCYKMKASYEMKEPMDLEGNWHFFRRSEHRVLPSSHHQRNKDSR